ncbi:MAG: transcriptional repressor [Muribaculaceae bacterium]|nr:transcriptional repressor [Muribaculaceae bacterium]
MAADDIRESASAQILSEFLRRTRRRCTPERYMVLASAESMAGHFTVEDLSAHLAANGRRVATATVYSSLQLLVDCGLLRRLRLDDGAMRYEATPSNHYHLLCLRCGKIKDIRDPQLEELLKGRRFSAFTPAYFALSVYGVCSACARKARKKEKELKKAASDKMKSK